MSTKTAARRLTSSMCPRGSMQSATTDSKGRSKSRLFTRGGATAPVMTRHLVSNVRVLGEDERNARTLGLISLYRADGKSPFQGSRPPAMIADFDAHRVLEANRSWRFRSHVLRPFIVSGDLPASIAIRPQTL